MHASSDLRPHLFLLFIAAATSQTACFEDATSCVTSTDCFQGEVCTRGACQLDAPAQMPSADMATRPDQIDMSTDLDLASPTRDMRQPAPGCEPDTLTECGGVCVDVTTSSTHCGACDRPCAAGEVCDGGACATVEDCTSDPSACTGLTWCDPTSKKCEPGCSRDDQCQDNATCDTSTRECVCADTYHACGAECVDSTSPLTCGERCQPCQAPDNGAATCDAGQCGFACNEGHLACGGVCSACPQTPGITTVTCEQDRCVVAGCVAPYVECAAGCCPPEPPQPGALPDIDVDHETDIAVDSRGALHITAHKSDSRDLLYIHHDTITWDAKTIATIGNTGRHSVVLVDDQDNPHVFYYNQDLGRLYHTSDTGNGFPTLAATVAGQGFGNAGVYTSAAFDTSGTLHTIFYDVNNERLQYARMPAGAQWSSPTTIDSSLQAGATTSLAIDASGVLHAAYFNQSRADLIYKNNDTPSKDFSAAETLESMGNVGYGPSMQFDKNGDLHIIYYSYGRQHLRYIARVGGQWTQPEQVTRGGNRGQFNDLAIDDSGTLHVLFYNADGGDLEYTKRVGAAWSQPLTIEAQGNVGRHISMALDPFGRIHYVHVDSTNERLRYGNLAP